MSYPHAIISLVLVFLAGAVCPPAADGAAVTAGRELTFEGPLDRRQVGVSLPRSWRRHSTLQQSPDAATWTFMGQRLRPDRRLESGQFPAHGHFPAYIEIRAVADPEPSFAGDRCLRVRLTGGRLEPMARGRGGSFAWRLSGGYAAVYSEDILLDPQAHGAIEVAAQVRWSRGPAEASAASGLSTPAPLAPELESLVRIGLEWLDETGRPLLPARRGAAAARAGAAVAGTHRAIQALPHGTRPQTGQRRHAVRPEDSLLPVGRPSLRDPLMTWGMPKQLAPGEHTWQTLPTLEVNRPPARAARCRVWLLAGGRAPACEVFFDEVRFRRRPRIEIRPVQPSGQAGQAALAAEIQFSGLEAGATYRRRLTALDGRGRALWLPADDVDRVLPAERRTFREQVPIAAVVAGPVFLRLDLMDEGGNVLASRTARLGRLPALEGRVRDPRVGDSRGGSVTLPADAGAPFVGLVLAARALGEGSLESRLPGELGVTRVKLRLPAAAHQGEGGEGGGDSARGWPVRGRGWRVLAVIGRLPGAVSLASALAAQESRVIAALQRTAVRSAADLAGWQLGEDPGSFAQLDSAALDRALQSARAALARGRDVPIRIPWPLEFDAAPPKGVAVDLVGTLDRHGPRAIAGAAARLRAAWGTARAGRGTDPRGMAPTLTDVSLTLRLGPLDEREPLEARIAAEYAAAQSLVRALIAARAAGFPEVYVSADGPLAQRLRTPGGGARIALFALHTLTSTLGEALAIGSVHMTGDLEAHAFQRGSEGILAVWSRGGQTARLAALLGLEMDSPPHETPPPASVGSLPGGVRAVDLLGNVRPLPVVRELVGGLERRIAAIGAASRSRRTWRCEVDGAPVLIRGLDARLLRTQLSVRLTRGREIASRYRMQPQAVQITNHFDRETTFLVRPRFVRDRAREARGWKVVPAFGRIHVAPGQSAVFAYQVRPAFTALAGPVVLELELTALGSATARRRFVVHREVLLNSEIALAVSDHAGPGGSRRLLVNARWLAEPAAREPTARAPRMDLSIHADMQGLKSRQRAVVVGLLPGQTRLAEPILTFPNPQPDQPQVMRIGARERGGDRFINLLYELRAQ